MSMSTLSALPASARRAVANAGDDQRAIARQLRRTVGFGCAGPDQVGQLGSVTIPDKWRKFTLDEAAHDGAAENAGTNAADLWFFVTHETSPSR
jgi:hypothetical protein